MSVRSLLVFASVFAALPAIGQPLTIETVPVGNPGNPADPLNAGAVPGIGVVNYEYRIGRFEVTNGQYANFLNAVAATDDFGLYNPLMSSDVLGGIEREGSPGSYVYTVKPGSANRPVIYVSYWDAARFSNWLSTGFTEGRASIGSPLLPGAAYNTNFATTPLFAAGNRLPGALFALPTENEWYKAAFYHPQVDGGPADSYWLFATRSDTQPTSRTPAAFPNSANYYFSDGLINGINAGYAVTQDPNFTSGVNYLTEVGAYGPDSQSYVGTADQNGNVWEWNETNVSGSFRGARGGSYGNPESSLNSPRREGIPARSEFSDTGFRIVNLAPVPEPGTYAALAGLVALAVVGARRRGSGTS